MEFLIRGKYSIYEGETLNRYCFEPHCFPKKLYNLAVIHGRDRNINELKSLLKSRSCL